MNKDQVGAVDRPIKLNISDKERTTSVLNRKYADKLNTTESKIKAAEMLFLNTKYNKFVYLVAHAWQI